MASPLEAASVFEVAELVAYQPGGVVSRVLVKRAGAGSVTAFAFDAGEELSEHTAPFDALLHVIDGNAEVTIAGTVYEVASGRMILLPAHVPHAVRAPVRMKMLLTMIRAPQNPP